jgi:hypothetical protein
MVLSSIKSIAKFIVFVVVGIVAIVVGSFMIRGTMHMWDRQKKSDDDKKQ